MNRKPLLWTGIALLVFGGIYTLTIAVLRASSVKLGTAGFDGDSGILAGIVVSIVGLLVSIYATAQKIDLGPVEIEQSPEEKKAPEPAIPPGENNGNNQKQP